MSAPGSVSRKVVAVEPRRELEARVRLFGALEAAFPVIFRPYGADTSPDAHLRFGDHEDIPEDGVPCLAMLSARNAVGGPALVRFTSDPPLDVRLRGHALRENPRPQAAVAPPKAGDVVLATCDGVPVWVRRGPSDIVAASPRELRENEVLRDRIQAGSWLSLLPLVHFLREVAFDLAWEPPPARALVMFDDPNLHWPTYGRLRFEDLVHHARQHGYHAALAMIPLDAWFVHPRVGRLFRENSALVSILIHGNNHVREELLRELPKDERRALLAQALRRMNSFAQKRKIGVSRVVSPPHGFCAEDVAGIMFAMGYEALTADWPFPWAPNGLGGAWPLANWEPGQLIAGGFPVLPRYLLSSPLDDVLIRAYLGQPVILYGHHPADLDLLQEATDRVNRLGFVRWGPIDAIARSNFAIRREGNRLRVRLYSRKIELEIPPGVEEVIVETGEVHGKAAGLIVVAAGVDATWTCSAAGERDGARLVFEPLVSVAEGRAELTLFPATTVDSQTVPPPRLRPWPIARRVMAEARDRLLPFLQDV